MDDSEMDVRVTGPVDDDPDGRTARVPHRVGEQFGHREGRGLRHLIGKAPCDARRAGQTAGQGCRLLGTGANLAR